MLGVLGVVRHGYEGHGTFFLGKWSGKGNPLYFIVAFLIKTPIPSILFIFTGLVVMLRNRMGNKEWFLIITIAAFFAAASFSNLQLGLRYILPIYPLCFIIAGRSLEVFGRKSMKIPLIALALWYVGSSLWIWPNYLSYFNEFIGGPKNGYKYLRDSNIDWGQDLPMLADYLKKKKIDKVKLLYFGTADPAAYGIKYDKLADGDYIDPLPGVYAISVQYLDAVKWAKDRVPAARIGYSIFVFWVDTLYVKMNTGDAN
jgi:hypothetical protein